MKLFLKTKDYSVSNEEFDLLYDSKLDMLVTQPQPENLFRYYESEAYISHTDAKTSFVDRLYQFVKGFNLKNKVQVIENQDINVGKLLDFGAGTGDFLTVAKKSGFEVSGIEPNQKARDRAKQKGIELSDSLANLNDRKYGVITLWHVLEHLPNLDGQLVELKELLQEDGLLVVAVPNYRSFDAKHYKSHWAAYDVPRHLWHFSRTSISKLFERHQMEVVKTYPMIFDSFYVSLLSEKYRGNNFYFLPALAVGLWSNISAWFNKEYSSVIYLIKKKQ
ncbi:class I SAM-dependent methyltransferase [Flagellimonas algicola]|uniref:Class I SAM-dependent methyltransferase n=1 Tax=Flagellimonas algicola TaxID=2583815 RepID=A0ABY2WJQ3_9FLAO|nr:class I SAM-dependent methyltransferase [Allomuricauda algicola]TMU55074.1 class I SAM-dependent methyltransferase [Allomuricauda algicola]